MKTLETLTDADIKAVVGTNPYRKARSLRKNIRDQVRQGETLTGQIRGSKLYTVEATVDSGAIHAVCSCPYDWGGYCKHIGALLLKWIYEPRSFATQKATGTPLDLVPVKPIRSRKPKALPSWINDSLTARREKQTAQLVNWLEQYRLQDMRDMAKSRNWKIRGTRKAEVAQQIAIHMRDADNIAATLATLTLSQRATLNALAIVGNSPTIKKDALTALATQWHKEPASLSELGERGLAVPQHAAQHELSLLSYDVMPDALMSALQPQLALVPTAMPPTDVVAGDAATCLQHISQLLLILERDRPNLPTPQPRLGLEKYHKPLKGWRYDEKEIGKLQQAGRLSATAKPDLTVPPPPYALTDKTLIDYIGSKAQLDFYYRLLHACDLLYIGSPVRVWQEIQLEYVQRQPSEQHALLVRAYFEMKNWNELWQVLRPALTVHLQRSWIDQFKPDDLADDLTVLRQRVLRLLACLPDNAWVALSEVETLLFPIWQLFDATTTQVYAYYYYHRGTKPRWRVTHLGGDVGWERGQHPFVQQVIETLHWLGLADIGRTDDDITHFRLHGLADLFWNRELVPIELETNSATLQNEGTLLLVAPNAISGAAHTFLDSICRLTQTNPTQFGYQLDAAAVHATFEDGLSLPDLLRTWREHFDVAPPSAIKAQLDAWWTRYGEVRLYDDVVLIEFGDEYALAEMQAVTSLNNHLIAQLTPQLVLVKQSAVDTLAAELQQAGYTPKMDA